MRDRIFFAHMLLLLFISTPLHADSLSAEMQLAANAAVRDAKKQVFLPAWFAVGCVSSLPGVVYADLATPKLPVGVLIGKSPTYVETYARVYRDRVSEKRALAAGFGCVISGAVWVYVIRTYLYPVPYDEVDLL